MKVNLLSFTDYKLKLHLYYKKNMDFFSYLLLKIITKDEKEERLLKDILLDFDISESLMYLASNAYYRLIDNNLIENNLEFEVVKHKDIKINNLAYKSLANNCLYILDDIIEKNICINPINDQIVANDFKYKDDYLVYNKTISKERILEIVNKNKKGLISDYQNYEIDVEILEANPFFSEIEVKENQTLEFDLNIKDVILDNLQFLKKENQTNYQKDLVILTKEYEITVDDKYDFIATIDNDKYGCYYHLVESNIGLIPMIKRTLIK